LRKNEGEEDLKIFSELVGVSKTALYNYEKGIREPTSKVLATYSQRFGVNLNWLLTGQGEVYAFPQNLPKYKPLPTIDNLVYRRVISVMRSVHVEATGKRQSTESLLAELPLVYNALIEEATNPFDTQELLNLIPWLEAQLKKKYPAEKIDPTARKKQA
jgi:transcriptional regulator with XRE-family HTH domain